MAEALEQQPEQQPDVGGTSETSTSGRKHRDLRQEITDRMVQALEQGQIPWERPWENLDHGLPRNLASGLEYKGVNRMLLIMTQMDQGYADPRFGTVKQINELGGRVNKGEKGHPIEVWKDQPFWERRDVEISHNGSPVKVFGEDKGAVHVGSLKDKISTLDVSPADLAVRHKGQDLSWVAAHNQLDTVVGRVYTVFNAEQCAGLKIEPLKTLTGKIPAVERAEELKQAMIRDGLAFDTHPSHAFYSPKRDEVSLPPRESFKTVEGYYGTTLHEIGHATGAIHRLKREGITGGHRFGSEGYAKEELRAELFSTFMAAETGIPHDETQHKAYVQSWAKVLKQDKNEIFRAAAEAGKAVDYVLAKEHDLQIAYGQDFSAAVETAQVKEPHEMTFAEFSDAARAEKLGPGHGRQWEVFIDKVSLGFADGPTVEGALRQAHQREVNNALHDNQHGAFRPQDVPAKTMPPAPVLAEYPELQTKFAEDIARRPHADAVAIEGVAALKKQDTPAPTKAAHEMTFAEFSGTARAEKPEPGRQWKVLLGDRIQHVTSGPTESEALRQAHKSAVNNALYGNSPDAPSWTHQTMPSIAALAEYPDLQQRWAAVIEQKLPALDTDVSQAVTRAMGPNAGIEGPEPGRQYVGTAILVNDKFLVQQIGDKAFAHRREALGDLPLDADDIKRPYKLQGTPLSIKYDATGNGTVALDIDALKRESVRMDAIEEGYAGYANERSQPAEHVGEKPTVESQRQSSRRSAGKGR